MFLTNTSIYTRLDCQKRLQRMGLDASIDEVITAAYISGLYFQEFNPDAHVLVIGEEAIKEELQRCNVVVTENPSDATHVLVGLDRQFSYEKLRIGMRAVLNGAQLIAANPDTFCPTPDGIIPDTWGIAKAIEAAGTTNILTVVGKPSIYYIQKVLERVGVRAEQCLMVGDRLETDIMLGINSGIKTALVLTGVTTIHQLEDQRIKPDYVFSTLGDLCSQFKIG